MPAADFAEQASSEPGDGSIVVRTLAGKKNLAFYLRCLRSLLDNCADPIHLAIHEDGTFDDEARDQAREALGDDLVILSRAEGNDRTLDALLPHPNARKLREESIWGVEFFDPLFADDSDPLSFYVDADILFFRPFRGLFRRDILDGKCIFLRDVVWHAYSLRPQHLLGPEPRPRAASGITTAVVCWDKRLIDWDYVEWFLSKPEYRVIPEWTLPTLQAGLALSANGHAVIPEQIVNAYPKAALGPSAFAVHLLGSYRKEWLPEAERAAEQAAGGEPPGPRPCRLEPCRPLGPLAFAMNQRKRKLNNRFGIFW